MKKYLNDILQLLYGTNDPQFQATNNDYLYLILILACVLLLIISTQL